MRIAIVGAGALGCVFGAVLAAAGNDVWLVVRSPERAAVLNRDGLTLTEPGGSDTPGLFGARSSPLEPGGSARVAAVRATAQPADAGVVDVVIVLVKSYDTAEAMTAALPLLGPDTTVLTLQNGVGNEELLAGIVGAQRLLSGRSYVGGVRTGPAAVRGDIAGRSTILGGGGDDGERARVVAECFAAAGLTVRVADDIEAVIWDKLLVNVATGALSAITGLTYGPLYAEPMLRQTALAAVGEAIAVARASGIGISMTDPEQPWLLAGAGMSPDFKTSMLQSVGAGNRTEIDVINGAVVRHGLRCGVPTPVNRTLVACVTGIERRNCR